MKVAGTSYRQNILSPPYVIRICQRKHFYGLTDFSIDTLFPLKKGAKLILALDTEIVKSGITESTNILAQPILYTVYCISVMSGWEGKEEN